MDKNKTDGRHRISVKRGNSRFFLAGGQYRELKGRCRGACDSTTSATFRAESSSRYLEIGTYCSFEIRERKRERERERGVDGWMDGKVVVEAEYSIVDATLLSNINPAIRTVIKAMPFYFLSDASAANASRNWHMFHKCSIFLSKKVVNN